MHSLQSLPQTAQSPRIAMVILAAIVCIAAPLHTVNAGDALTTSSSSSSSSTSGSTQLERSILGLPIGIIKSVASGISKAASTLVTKHVTKN
jgi:hypothetical protein